jgi:hypothetical protein
MTLGHNSRLLVELLTETAALLRRYGETHWAAWMERDAALLRRSDAEGIRHLLSAFGGMGSFNDLWLDPRNGHAVTESAVVAVNEDLSDRQARIYRLATELNKIP